MIMRERKNNQNLKKKRQENKNIEVKVRQHMYPHKMVYQKDDFSLNTMYVPWANFIVLKLFSEF